MKTKYDRERHKMKAGGRHDMPCPSPPPGGGAPKSLPPPSRQQRGSSFPRPTRSHAHRCSCLTRQHGGEQSGLVTLTFDLLTLKVVSQSRVVWATSVPILVFLGLSVLDLGPMYATARRQTKASLNATPIRGGHNNRLRVVEGNALYECRSSRAAS